MSTNIQSAAAMGHAGTRETLSLENRQQLTDLAAEFESMLLTQMVRDMNESGKWADTGESSLDTFGAKTFDQTFQVELSRFLAQAGGLGLSQQLLKALDSMAPQTANTATASAGTPAASTLADLRQLPIVNEIAAAVSGAVGELKLPASTVTSAYGWRPDPFTGEAKFHKGIDLKAAEGSDVAAAGAGRVTFAGVSGGYGTTVVVEHANGLSTRYAHLSEVRVQAGDEIASGQVIGLAGSTGRATAPHLHFEVLEDGVQVDPRRLENGPRP
jgi:murein DD-endopeptidase MepM/ murein hydrolase activator NlpD